jgi:hypothetical protein
MLSLATLTDGIRRTVRAWRLQASPDERQAEPGEAGPDKQAQPEAASPDKPAERKSRLRRLLSNKRVLWAASTFIFAVLAVLGTNTGSAIWDLPGRITAAHPGAPRSQPTAKPPALPFAVDATEDFESCNAFALPAALGQGRSYAQLTNSASPTYAAWGTFLNSVSGAPVSQVAIALTFSSGGGSPVRVTDIEVKQVKTPGPNYSGAYIPVPHQGGGDNSYNFTVDLDHPNATLQGTPGQENFPAFEINVSAGLASTVYVQFTGTKHSYSWVFVIDYDEDGTNKTKTYQVRAPGGGPFTLTGASAAYRQVFAASSQGYVLTTTSDPGGH